MTGSLHDFCLTTRQQGSVVLRREIKIKSLQYYDNFGFILFGQSLEMGTKAQTERYKISGKVYIWAYKDNYSNYPGWNFTANTKASENLSELLNLMSECELSTKKKIMLALPTQAQLNVPNNQNGLAKWKSKPNLILNYKTSESKNHWLISEIDNGIEIQFGKAKLNELQSAINEIPKGHGDFAISDKKNKNILFFWWNLEN